MIPIQRLINLLAGDVPGGLWPLLGLCALWLWISLRVLPGTGVYRERRPGAIALAGLVVLLTLFVLLRQRVTARVPDTRFALWPLENLPAGVGEGLAAIQEADLLRQGGSLVSLRHGLEGPRASALAAPDSILATLKASDLICGSAGDGALVLEHWRRRWRVTGLEARVTVDLPSRLDSTALASLQRTYSDFCADRMGLASAVSPQRTLLPESLPLFTAVHDSALYFSSLPARFRQPEDELRAADQLLAYARKENAARIVASLNAGLDDSTQTSAELFLMAATWFAWEGQWDRVIQAVDNSLALEPGNPRAWWIVSHLDRQGLAHFGMEQSGQARAHALELQPGYRPALFEEVPRLVDLRRLNEAHQFTSAALVLYRNDPELLILAGNVERVRMAYGQAERHYRAALDLLDADYRPWWNLGQMYYMTGSDSLAVDCLEHAVALGCPPEALHLLGMSWKQLGNRDRAIWFFRQRMKLGGSPEELDRSRRQLAELFPELQP
ncbi:MAG: hypothetical protein KC488_15305 [Candidatus Cloacimonetes bacterium]|nr:hypothetical protein [Candidatus Cloacimonadota bacterium]